MFAAPLLALAAALPLASAHISIWHPSMYGFNVTDHTYDYDNRPVVPLTNFSFQKWWFHNHLDHPPHPGDFFELPAGKPATTELACNKGATTWFNSSEGGDIRQGDSPCPNSDTSAYHTTGFNDLKGCALAIAYESDVTKIQPEDFTVFSINQTCVWTRFTDFQVPARMPPCPPGGCHCAWFWIHSQDSGGEQNYMNGFKCNVTGSTSDIPLAKPQVPRRCGADPDNDKPNAAPGNCTYGAKQPFYWFQQERNNMFEGTYSPPFYTDLYNFKDGAQDDIFKDSYPNGIPAPSPNSTVVPTPFLGSGAVPVPTSASDSVPYGSASSTSGAASTSASASPSSASQASNIGSASAASASSAASTSFSASTLSQTASLSSAAISSSLSPDLPLSTHSASLSSIIAPSSGQTSATESVKVTTSTVVSTLVITLTTGAPAASQSAQASSTPAISSSSSAQSTTLSTSTVSTSAPGRSTIFLNAPSAPLASASTPAPTTSAIASQSDAAGRAAPTTIDLNFAVRPNGSSESTVRAAAVPVRPGVLAATSANAMCKRQFRRKVTMRRRSVDSPDVTPQVELGMASAKEEEEEEEEEEESTILSRISIPGLRRHRRLQERSSLWRFF